MNMEPIQLLNPTVTRYISPLQSVCAICEMVKKISFHRRPYTDFDMVDLLADVVSYISNRHDLGEVMDFNANKLKARYPDGFS